MAKSTRKNYPKAVTPVGVAAYAWLYKPDEGGKYSDGKYKVTLVVDKGTDLSRLTEACEEAARIEWGEVPEDLVYPYRDGDNHKNEEFRGCTLMTIKTKNRPGVVGPDPKIPLPEGVEARSGDRIRCSVIAMPYQSTETVIEVVDGKKKRVTTTTKGVTLLLRGVQLIEKRNMGGDVSNDFDDEFADAAEDIMPVSVGSTNTEDDDDDYDDDDI